MRRILPLFLLLAGCFRSVQEESFVAIQIQDRNGLTETMSAPDRLETFSKVDFLSTQPYTKVLRVYRKEGKNQAKITTYHPNGTISQYLEVEEMRAFGAYREWHPNGQQKIEAHVIGGTAELSKGSQADWLFDGESLVWNEEGDLVAAISYAKGSMEGMSRYFHPNGKVAREVNYSKNSIDGNWVEYFPDGTLQSKTKYVKGMKGGLSLGYYENGEPRWIEEYSEGLVLKGAYYLASGELFAEVENGWGFQAQFFPSGIELVEIQRGQPEGIVKRYSDHLDPIGFYNLKKGKKHGEEVEYFLPTERASDEGDPLQKLSLQWNQDAIHGTVKTWYMTGQLQSQKEFCRNQISGPSCAWYKNGSLMYLEEYEDGRLVKGLYYKVGQTEPVTTVTNGSGTVTLFDEDGIFLKKIQYSKGKATPPE